jgi:hypothetical protein
VAELADALDLKSSSRTGVWVRVPPGLHQEMVTKLTLVTIFVFPETLSCYNINIMDNISLAMVPNVTSSVNERFIEMKQRLENDLLIVKSKVSGASSLFAFNKLAYDKAVRHGNFAEIALLLVELRNSEHDLRISVNNVALSEQVLRSFVTQEENISVLISEENVDVSISTVSALV